MDSTPDTVDTDTATANNLCVDNGATACGTIKAGDSTGGSVGIGDTTPSSKLEVLSSEAQNYSARIINDAGAGSRPHGALIRTINQSSTATDPILRVGTIANDWFDVQADGKVGIGTITPDRKLDVQGDVTLTGNSGVGYYLEGWGASTAESGWLYNYDDYIALGGGGLDKLLVLKTGNTIRASSTTLIGDGTGFKAQFTSSVDAEGLTIANSAGRSNMTLRSAINSAIVGSWSDTSGEVGSITCDRDGTRTCRFYTNISASSISMELNQVERLVMDATSTRILGPVGSAVWKYHSVTLADDASLALDTNFGTAGILTVVGSGNTAYCQYAIRGSENLATEQIDSGGKCADSAAADPDGSVNFNADGDGTYTLRNRTGGSVSFSIQFVGF
jgi:hypothetical protein